MSNVGFSQAPKVLLAIVFLATLAPFWLVETPPVLDYPNHFARLWMIGGGLQESPLSHIYAIDWGRAATNLGGDLLAVALSPVVGREVAPRLLLALAYLLPPLGGVLLHRRLFGGFHWWQLTFAFACWNMTALAGFMNFQLGCGLALIAAAMDPTERPLFQRALARAVFASLTVAFHPFAAAFYICLATAMAAGRNWSSFRSAAALWSAVPSVTLAAAAAAIPVAIILMIAPNPAPTTGPGPLLGFVPFSLTRTVSLLMTGFRSYSFPLDAVAGALVIGLIGFAAWRRRLNTHAGLFILAITLAALALVMPTRVAESYWIDRRLPVMAFITLLAAVQPAILMTHIRAVGVALLLAAAGLARTGLVAHVWLTSENDTAAVRRAIVPVGAGCRVLVLAHRPDDRTIASAPPGRYFGGAGLFWNYGALVAPDRLGFVPNLFTQPGQQPLKVLGAYKALSAPFGPPPTLDTFDRPGNRFQMFMNRWREFDYALVLNADLADTTGGRLPPELTKFRDEGFAQLWLIHGTRSAGACGHPATPAARGFTPRLVAP